MTHTLIQNVSDQCIPNLVAAKTFHPRRIIWICTQEKKQALKYLQAATEYITPDQAVWEVDARNSETMQRELTHRFKQYPDDGDIVYHLTCGTKSMAVQTVIGLATHISKRHVKVSAVVMDPRTQKFDVLFPKANNDAFACSFLSFTEVLKIHGSERRDKSGRAMQDLKKIYEPLEQLRRLHKPLMKAMKDRRICSKEEARNGYFLHGGSDLPTILQQALYLAQEAGAIKQLRIQQQRFSFQPVHSHDAIAYIRNTWMEDWAGAVLAKHDDGAWRGGYSSVKVNIKNKGDYQEFDFLGVRNNHLVYWSCKNIKEVKPAQLFEVDALKDEVGGRDFHISGLIHTPNMDHGLKQKAARLGVKLLQVTRDDAEETLVRLSCQ